MGVNERDGERVGSTVAVIVKEPEVVSVTAIVCDSDREVAFADSVVDRVTNLDSDVVRVSSPVKLCDNVGASEFVAGIVTDEDIVVEIVMGAELVPVIEFDVEDDRVTLTVPVEEPYDADTVSGRLCVNDMVMSAVSLPALGERDSDAVMFCVSVTLSDAEADSSTVADVDTDVVTLSVVVSVMPKVVVFVSLNVIDSVPSSVISWRPESERV